MDSANTFDGLRVAYTPPFRIKYSVEGDSALLYFECPYVDKAANKIAAPIALVSSSGKVNGPGLAQGHGSFWRAVDPCGEDKLHGV